MPSSPTPLDNLRHSLAAGTLTPRLVAENSLAHASCNQSRNTYLHLDPLALANDAAALEDLPCRPPLFSVPVSLKDCFDLAGMVTTAGTRFYAERNAPATSDSAVVARLRSLGCLVTGKTHLHPLAYGITGENPDFGDCLQPRDPDILTGGSSSGAAASVQEGSALFAIGTDTGGSIRVPAALCGLAGFRASHLHTQRWPDMWRGAMHLAPTFDTLGFLCSSPHDLAPIAQALFDLSPVSTSITPRIGTVSTSFLAGCDSAVFESFAVAQDTLTAAGCDLITFNTASWSEALDIFAPIQAHEAAALHAGNFDHFESSIAERLRWGASIIPEELSTLRDRHQHFRARLNSLFERFNFLILPAAPVHELRAGADHSAARPNILRYTTPFSLAGNPVVTLPGELLGALRGTGLQLAAAPGHDAELLAFTTTLVSTILSGAHDV
jgi:aspartyl-tRNA(Asn)/glutamyl-tRNA(Gln) amidotransferase subunit A